MKKLYFSFIFLFVLQLVDINGQINVSLTVESANTGTTCDDLFSGPDIVWSVDVDNEGATYYPLTGSCFTALPNVQYLQSYACPGLIPATVNVCFTVFENDPIFNACDIVPSCEETICQDFVIPAIGESLNYTLALPAGGGSSGELSFTLDNNSLVPIIDNDLICDAVDLGTISYGGTLGDATTSAYYNHCATNTGDEDPTVDNSFDNQVGVWFQFSTGANPSGEILIHGFSDPGNLGDPIDIEIAVYESTTGDCTGNMIFLNSGFNNGALDITVPIICPSPNNTYFILVDGATTLDPDNLLGVFGLELMDVGVIEGGDLRCDYVDLGIVPEGGSVETAEWYSNFCSTDVQDPYLPTFISQHSVWFGFTAPPSGHVLIEGVTDTLVDSIGLQIALYRSFNNMCNGPFIHVASEYSIDELDQSLEATCLYPDKPYFILVDGTGFNSKGIFKIKVSDAGDITPRTTIDTVLCAGEVMEIGSSDYTESGTYADSIHLFRACDSIVFSTITFLDPIEITFEDVFPALGETNTGRANLSVTGGTGNYTFQWCDGQTSTSVSDLLGGTSCCVTVTDDKGCSAEACLDVMFITGVAGVFENDTLLCFGDQTGELSFSASNGQLPYQYEWSNADQSFTGQGEIITDNENVTVGGNLPAGSYSVTLTDAFSADTLLIEVVEPTELSINLIQKEDLICFEQCEGMIDIEVTGGTGSYGIAWSSGQNTEDIDHLCADTYMVSITDENGCLAVATFDIEQPLPFTAIADVQEVSCFEGMDGAISLSFENGEPASYLWNTSATSPALNNLQEGFYSVVVTSTLGCESFVEAEVKAPGAPLEVALDIVDEVSCFGALDARIQANVSGPGQSVVYDWNTGESDPIISNKGVGTYGVTVMNENGCEASSEVIVGQPDALFMELTPKDITCLDPSDGGSIRVDTIYGGRPPYSLMIDEQVVISAAVVNGLSEGNYLAELEDASGCKISEEVAVLGPPELLVDLGEDITIHLGDETEIQAIYNSGNVQLTWAPIDTIETDVFDVSPIISTLYSVIAFDTLTKCTATDEVFVWVDKRRDVFVPNVFSPNDDGRNDIFYPFGGKDVMEIASFQIFARNGMLVYSRSHFLPNDPNQGWDGQVNGKLMNTGVFVYQMEVVFKDGVSDIFAGDVVLMK